MLVYLCFSFTYLKQENKNDPESAKIKTKKDLEAVFKTHNVRVIGQVILPIYTLLIFSQIHS